MHVVQIGRNGGRRVGVVEGREIRLLRGGAPASVYALAMDALTHATPLVKVVDEALGTERLDYDAVYEGRAEWKFLPSFDHPADAAHCTVSGTGLTHKASAENRAAMHTGATAEMTDSMRMYRMGMEGGRPEPGAIGVQPEWFYKGDGSVLRGHNDALEIPAYGWDGGEEPEVAGAYLIAPEGRPVRVGWTMANEFSDHQMEKKNYLYLAPSKLRTCSIGPELVIGEADLEDVSGRVRIERGGKEVWAKSIWSGEKNMSHSIGNLEHHHFKYALHRRPGDVHVHYLGADAFSFGEDVTLEDGDVMEVEFAGLGRALRNPLRIAKKGEELVRVGVL